MTPDHSDIARIEERMKKAAKHLHLLASEVGMAITIIDYDSDRRKNLIARYAAKHIKDGQSSVAAETLARSDPTYDMELNSLLSQYQDAQTTKKEFETEQISWETARSLLARQRETLRTLPDTEA
jgi:hypothetical protein